MAFAHGHATNTSPLSFGADQTIIDLNTLEWAPLELEGFAPGAEIAVLRGDLATAGEALVRVPAGYTVPNHSHTSDETYVWLTVKISLDKVDTSVSPTPPVQTRPRPSSSTTGWTNRIASFRSSR